MKPNANRASIVLLALAAATACSTGTPYASAVAAMPAVAPGQGRILIYMSAEQGGWWPILNVDGQVLGRIRPGTFFYVDRPEGPHQVGVAPDPHLEAFGNQGATTPATLLVQPGQIAYVQVTLVATPGMITAVLAPEIAPDAQRDLAPLDLVPPSAP